MHASDAEPSRVVCEDAALATGSDRPLDDEEMSRIAHALAHPARIAIVRQLLGQDGCVAGEIFDRLSLAQSTVSEHLRVLKDADVICSTAHGNRTYYCLHKSTLVRFGSALSELAEA